MVRLNYCYDHNIALDNDALYDEHKDVCKGQLHQQNLCKQHANNGSMCGQYFKNTEELKQHSLEVHKVYICETCDAQSTAPLANHAHRKGEKNIHQSELR